MVDIEEKQKEKEKEQEIRKEPQVPEGSAAESNQQEAEETLTREAEVGGEGTI